MKLTGEKPGTVSRYYYKKQRVITLLLLCLSSIPLYSAEHPDGYTLVRTDPEVVGRHKYDGSSVYREHTATRHWQHAVNPGEPFTDTRSSLKDGPIEGHNERIVVHVEPFRSQDAVIPRDQRQNFIDLYQYISDIIDTQKIPFGPLFYRPQGVDAIFHTLVTQQRWERVDRTLVDFLVVSYKRGEKLRFLDDATTAGGISLNGHLPEPGLYKLIVADNDPDPRNIPQPVPHIPGRAAAEAPVVPEWTGRWEKWKRLEGDGTLEEPITEIRVPHGVLSIPGVGLFAVNDLKTADDKLSTLKVEKESADRDVAHVLAQAGTPVPSIILTGPVGCGKTTLINLWAGNPCVSQERADGTGYALEFPHPLPHFTVGHAGHAQTTRPACYPDAENKIVLIDNAGDDDPKGDLQDLINASMMYMLFNNQAGVKLALTVEESLVKTSRGVHFIKALETLINSFEDDTTLHQLIHLLVSKRTNLNIQKYLVSLFGNPGGVPPVPQDAKLEGKPRLISLVKFLIDNPERVSTSAAPEEDGPFVPDLTDVKRSFLSGPYAVRPKVKIKIKDESHYLVQGLERRLNEDLVDFLRRKGAQQIIRYCLKRIEDHNSTAADLRNEFLGLARRLKALSVRGTPEEFLNVFDGVPARVGVAAIPQLFDAKEMRDIIANLRFLKALLPHNINFNIRDWKDALTSASPYLDTIGKIENLAKKPKVTFQNGTLAVKGIFVGSSDVETAVRAQPTSPESIVIHALNTWFIEQNMTHHGTHIYSLAPRWKATPGNKEIIVSGLNGGNGSVGANGVSGTDTITATAGSDGGPGEPGKNSGSFFGKLHTHVNLAALKIIAKGGKGGDGGKGGTGGAGRDAGNGNEASMQVISDSGDVCIIPWGDHPHQNTAGPYYPHRLYHNVSDRWTYVGGLASWIGPKFTDQIWVWGHVEQLQHAPLGKPGKDGGKGGQKGLGGHAGEIIIQGTDVVQKEQTAGVQGTNDGSAGAGGEGGRNGMVLNGTKWTRCRIESELSPNPANRWNAGPSHSEPAQRRAANGSTPGTLSTTPPITALAIVSIDKTAQDAKIAEYSEYYRAEASDPLVSPFVMPFPGLEQ